MSITLPPSKESLERSQKDAEELKKEIEKNKGVLEELEREVVPIFYREWGKRELWQIKEGAQLVAGFLPVDDPERTSKQRITRFQIGVYKQICAIAETAVAVGTLKPYHYSEMSKYAECMRVIPRDFLKWVKSKDFEIPAELAHLLEKAERQDSTEERLDPRERTSLLQIIAVLAAEAKLDLTKHSKAAETLQAMGAKHVMELPKKKDTIASKLKEARDLEKTR